MKLKSTFPVSLHPMPLAAYLTGAVGSSFLVSAPQAEAAVTSVTFGSVFDGGSGSGYFLSTPYVGQLGGYAGGGFVVLGFGPAGGYVYNQNQFDYKGYMGLSRGTPTVFGFGSVIGSGDYGALGKCYFSNPNNAALTVSMDGLNWNIGFQTKNGNWGWASVNWNAAGTVLTFNRAYVESVLGKTIVVGADGISAAPDGISAAPEPSRALLGLAGLAGVALRRRRKQVA